MEKNVVITGVSTGIGRATLDLLHSKGFNVFGSIRNQADADKLSKIYPNRFTPLQFDVQNHDEVVKASKVIFDQCESLVGLINNAGIAVPGPLEHLSEKKFEKQLDINVKSVRRITNLFLPLLGAKSNPNKPPGRIINISSLSGLFNSPFNGAYCISKHALESMTDIYRRELKQFGIKVSAIEPGPIRTEIWKKNLNKMDEFEDSSYFKILQNANKIIKNSEQNALPVEKVSKLIAKCLIVDRPKTRYIVHKKKFVFRIMAYYFSDKLADWLVYKTLSSENRHRPF